MVVDRLYSADVAERFKDVEMILGCGDLPYEYLEFLVSAMNVPLLYIPGNHDPLHDEKNPKAHVQGGCNIDLRVEKVKGLNFAGIGGSIRYRPGTPNQYSQIGMYLRLRHLFTPLLWHTYRRHERLDVVIAHSPPKGIHDDDDQAHQGFAAFNDFIRLAKPRYLFHGHTMFYKGNLIPPVARLGPTEIINVYPYRVIDI
jgi:uncharacterized protein